MRAAGAKSATVFCEESTWGTTPTFDGSGDPAAYGLNFKSNDLKMTKNLFQSDAINQYRAIMGLTDGNKAVAGNIVTDLVPKGIEILIKHLLGKNGTSNKNPADATGSDPYTHLFKGYASTFPGLSIEKRFEDINQFFLYKGCLINGMNINIIQEGFHDVTFDFIGKEEVVTQTQNIQGATYQTADGYNGYQCKVYINDGGGYDLVGNVVSGSISIQNNIETDGYVLGSPLRASASFGRRECSGDLVLFFEDLTEYKLFVDGTLCGLKIIFDNSPNGDLSADSITFEFPSVKLGGDSPAITDFRGINLPLNFRAKYNASSETDVVVTVVNDIATVANT